MPNFSCSYCGTAQGNRKSGTCRRHHAAPVVAERRGKTPIRETDGSWTDYAEELFNSQDELREALESIDVELLME